MSTELMVPTNEYILEPTADIPTDCPSPDVCGADAVCRGQCSGARVAMVEVFVDLGSISYSRSALDLQEDMVW